MTETELMLQVAAQCKAVSHMATAIARVHDDFAKLFEDGRWPINQLTDQVGDDTARRMEFLGGMLNGMDACTEEDDWINPIFEESRRLWPQTRDVKGKTELSERPAEAPIADEIQEFIDVVKKLEHFEAQQRYVRGYGAFDQAALPIPAYSKVLAWLAEWPQGKTALTKERQVPETAPNDQQNKASGSEIP